MGREVISKKEIQRLELLCLRNDATSESLRGGDLFDRVSEEEVSSKQDDYISRLLKYIPSEVIALYLMLDALIRSTGEIDFLLYWTIFIFGVIATPLYLWRIQKVNKNFQLLISTLAFFVWIFAIGGPFVYLSWYKPLYGGVLLPIYTFLISLIEA